MKSPVAQHIGFTGGGGAAVAAAIRARCSARSRSSARRSSTRSGSARRARYVERHPDRPRPVMEPVARRAGAGARRASAGGVRSKSRRRDRAGARLAKEFGLDPIIVGGAEVGRGGRGDQGGRGRVIYSLNFPTPPEPAGAGAAARGRRGRRRRVDAGRSGRGRTRRRGRPRFRRACRSRSPPADCRTSRCSCGTPRARSRTAVSRPSGARGADSGAAQHRRRLNRLGTLQRGRIANVVVTDGDWLEEKTRIRHVFIDGRPVEIDPPSTTPAGGGRRGGGGRGGYPLRQPSRRRPARSAVERTMSRPPSPWRWHC